MKRTYKLLGYLLLGIGAYAFLNANNTDLYAERYPLGQANSAVTEQQTTYKPAILILKPERKKIQNER